MSVKKILIVVLAGFCLLCGGLIVQSGFPIDAFDRGLILLQQTTERSDSAGRCERPRRGPACPQSQPQLQPAAGESFGAVGGPDVDVTIGSTDKASAFKYQLVLDSVGAAIRTATFSEFDDRDRKNPQPLTFLTPIDLNGSEVLSLANRDLVLINQGRRLNLDRLSWKSLGVEKLEDGGASAAFEATIVDGNDQPVLKLTKTYRVHPDNYMLDGAIRVENLSGKEQKVQYGLNGPVGLPVEGGYRMDMRKVIAAFKTPGGQIQSTGLDYEGPVQGRDGRRPRAAPPGNGGFVVPLGRHREQVLRRHPGSDDRRRPARRRLDRGQMGRLLQSGPGPQAQHRRRIARIRGLQRADHAGPRRPARPAARRTTSTSTWAPRTRAGSTRSRSIARSGSSTRSTSWPAAARPASSIRWPSASWRS